MNSEGFNLALIVIMLILIVLIWITRSEGVKRPKSGGIISYRDAVREHDARLATNWLLKAQELKKAKDVLQSEVNSLRQKLSVAKKRITHLERKTPFYLETERESEIIEAECNASRSEYFETDRSPFLTSQDLFSAAFYSGYRVAQARYCQAKRKPPVHSDSEGGEPE